LKHPQGAAALKGLTVRQLKLYMSWV